MNTIYDEIKRLLNEISDYPNVYVSQNQELVIEPMANNEIYRYLKFVIVRRNNNIDRVIYKANCKENNPNEYLNIILNDLLKMKKRYLNGGIL